MACDWLSIVRGEGEKAVSREPDAATPLSKRLWSMQVKVLMALPSTGVGDQARGPGGEYAPRSQGLAVMARIC